MAKRKIAGKNLRLDSLYDDETGELTKFGRSLYLEAKKTLEEEAAKDELTGQTDKRKGQLKFFKRTGKLPGKK